MRKIYAWTIAAASRPGDRFPARARTGWDSGSKTATTSTTKTSTAKKLDINSASKEELDALPGIGEAYAEKIVSHRPYRTKRDLLTKKILPQSTYDKIQDRITARQTTGSAAKSNPK